MTIGVYMIEHVATGRRYVGKSVDVEARIAGHFRGESKSCKFLHAAIMKYGKDAFSSSPIETCESDASAMDRERFWIRELCSLVPAGFNITTGGDGWSGRKHTDEAKNKVRAAKLGKCMSEETKAKLRAANLGKTMSPETRAKVRATLLGRPRPDVSAALSGRTISAEVRAKMSLAQRGHVITDAGKAAISVANTGNKYCVGRKLSAETRAKISASLKRRSAEEME